MTCPAPGWILSSLLQQAHPGEAARASTEAWDIPPRLCECRRANSLIASWSCWGSLGCKSERLPAAFKKEYSPSTYCRLPHRRRHEKNNVRFLNRSVPCLPTASPGWQVRGGASEDFIYCWRPELGGRSARTPAWHCSLCQRGATCKNTTEKMPDICALTVWTKMEKNQPFFFPLRFIKSPCVI